MDPTQEPDAAPATKAATADTAPPRKAPPSLLFRLVVPVTFIFVFSCFLVMTHDLLGDQTSAFAAFLREHGTAVLGWEAAAAIIMAIVAMAFDRMRTLRKKREAPNDPAAPAARPEESDDKPQNGN